MEISDQLHCLFSADVERDGTSYTVEVPASEIDLGSVEPGETYRVAILPSGGDSQVDSSESSASGRPEEGPSGPPVEEGERRTVEIDAIGDQGDGIARVERGFVVIVPDTDEGERVEVEIGEVRENVAFAEVVERLSYYE